MKSRWGRHWPDVLVILALLLSLGIWATWGLWLEGYFPLRHPFALPGARGLPGAGAFNTLVFVIPGALMAVLAEYWRRQLPEAAHGMLRIGCTLALLAALGWLAQGLVPLELEHLDAGSSRWHALAWTLWALAVGSAALLVALAVPRLRGWGVLLLVVLVVPSTFPSGSPLAILAQPLAVLVWCGWGWAGIRTRAAVRWH